MPASYPLTANALRSACNQTSNRDPVVDLDQQTVERTARALKERGLLRIVWSDTGRRTLKYHQILDERARARARRAGAAHGAAAPRARRRRASCAPAPSGCTAFADRGEVEACLRRMAERPQPLVRELERRPGQQDQRWVHLLGPVPQQAAVAAAAAVDREAVIADGAEVRDARVRSSYDAVAAAYAEHLVDELRGLPFETWLLDRVLAHADGRPVVEVGSGPGHVTAYLADGGADATGIDLSPAMVAEARRRFPGPTLRGRRPAAAEPGPPRARGGRRCWGGTRSSTWRPPSCPTRSPPWSARSTPADGWSSACTPGPRSATSTSGSATTVDLDVVLHEPAFVVGVVEAAGLVDVEWYLRGPLTARGETTAAAVRRRSASRLAPGQVTAARRSAA